MQNTTETNEPTEVDVNVFERSMVQLGVIFRAIDKGNPNEWTQAAAELREVAMEGKATALAELCLCLEILDDRRLAESARAVFNEILREVEKFRKDPGH